MADWHYLFCYIMLKVDKPSELISPLTSYNLNKLMHLFFHHLSFICGRAEHRDLSCKGICRQLTFRQTPIMYNTFSKWDPAKPGEFVCKNILVWFNILFNKLISLLFLAYFPKKLKISNPNVCLPLITSKHMANFSCILRPIKVWNIFSSYKVVKLNWGEASITGPLKNDNSGRHQWMHHIVGIQALGPGLVGICTVDQTRTTRKTESYILDLSSFAAYKTILCTVIDRFFKKNFKTNVFV